MAAAVALLIGRAAGLLFFAVALTYYLAYEVLHLLAHLPASNALTRSPLLHRLLRHHRLHHAPGVMNKGNYNIVFPFGDWLFGTLRRDEASSTGNGEPHERLT